MFSLGHLGQNMYRQEYFHILNIMHISEMSDVVMVKTIMMMLAMGAGFQFSSLTSGVVGQSVTAGDQQQWHYSSIVTGAQSTTQNNAHRYTQNNTQQTQEQFIAWSTHKAAQAQHTKEKERQAHYASSNVTQRTGTHKTTHIKHKNST